MTLVTRDATSGRWIPQSAAEYTSLLSGTGIANPSLLWLCQEVSGNLADSIGAFTGTGTGGPAYQQALAGWSMKGVKCNEGTTAVFKTTGLGASSALAFAWASYPGAYGATQRSVLTFGAAFGTQAAINTQPSTSRIVLDDHGGSGAGGTTNNGTINTTGVHATILQADATAVSVVAQTDLETLTHAMGVDTFGSFALGGDNVSYWLASDVIYGYVAVWTGANAQLDASHRAILIDRFTTGPAVTSIAVTPSPGSVAFPGTVQLTATATRADGSTYDATATATWSSGTPGVATVSVTGLVTAVATGTSIITASFTSLGAAPASGTSSVTVAGSQAPNKYARMMAALLPPGKVWRLIGESVLFEVLAACADELGRLDARTTALLNEADPSTAVELLPEYESELELDSTGTNAERQARIVARTIARQRYRPVDFQTALAPLLGQLPANVVVLERTHAFAVSIGDDREIFRFFIYRDPALPGAYYLASAQKLVDKIKPSHTIGQVIESVSFLCDDPFSLCERDLLGA